MLGLIEDKVSAGSQEKSFKPVTTMNHDFKVRLFLGSKDRAHF